MKRFFQCDGCEARLLLVEGGVQEMSRLIVVSPEGRVIYDASNGMFGNVPQFCENCKGTEISQLPNHLIGPMIGPIIKRLGGL